MPVAYEKTLKEMRDRPRTWLITGVAGFIGSNLLEKLLREGQQVVGLDNFSTGKRAHVDDVHAQVGDAAWQRFTFHEGDVADLDTCRRACEGADVVLHEAALGSVPRSIADPLASNRANVDGFLNMLVAAKDAGAGRFVYAASSSTYGDHPGLPKVEDVIGEPLSPYAVTKYVNELYAGVFAKSYGYRTIGLRYFNVFGRRQDPEGAYAAVIPRWVATLLRGERCAINGDGETTRDFTYIDNVVQTNLLAGMATAEDALDQVYNVGCGSATSLNELYRAIRDGLTTVRPKVAELEPQYGPFRAGDVRHSLADIGKARRLLGYEPTHTVQQGLAEALSWYAAQAGSRMK